MKSIKSQSFLLFFILVLLSCNKEEADPWKYLSPEQLKSNYIELRENTLLIPKEEQNMITSVTKDEITFSSDFDKELLVGDVIVNTGEGQENPKAFFRKVVSVSKTGQGTKVVTKEATLPEAYKRYYFDSRLEKTYLQTRSSRLGKLFELDKDLTPELGITIIPTGNIHPNADSIYFVTSYNPDEAVPDSLQGRSFFRLVAKGLRLDHSISFDITGKLESNVSAELPPFLIFTTTFGLSISLIPKAEITAGFEGSVSTPAISHPDLGPYDLIFAWDNINGVTESSFINSPLATLPSTTGDWDFSGEGGIDLKIGVEIAAHITGSPDLAKCGAFVYLYVEPSITKSGDFIDLSSKFNLNIEAGTGNNFFAETPFFSSLISNTNFILETEDYNNPFFNTSIVGLEICKFNAASVTYQNNQLQLNISKSGSVGFKVYFNDTEYHNGEVFAYNQPAMINASFLSNPINKLTIKDAIIQNCNISTMVVKPDFIPSDCDGFVTDPDGNRYCFKRFGDILWMVENYKYAGPGGIGRYYNNAVEGWEQIYGRLYTFNELMNGYNYLEGNLFKVQGICPQGWYIPSGAEFANLIAQLGGATNFGKNAKMNNALIWPNSQLPTTNTFSAVSGGEYYKWARPGSQFGQRFKKGFYWTSDFTQDADFSNPHVKVFEINNTNVASSIGSVGPSFLKKTILDMGYSCRCVKDI